MMALPPIDVREFRVGLEAARVMQLSEENLHNLHNRPSPIFSARAAQDEDLHAAAGEYEEWLDAVALAHSDPLPADLVSQTAIFVSPMV